MTRNWNIPSSVLQWIEKVPTNRPVALLLRHSVRDDLPPDDVGYTLPITESGERIAQELGRIIGQRLRTLHTSPLLRCIQTADALRQGAGVQIPITEDRLLGDPGIFVIDGKRAWRNWESLGHEGVMKYLVSSKHNLPGMAQSDFAARFLVHHMLAASNNAPGLHIFVTHDSLITATAAQLLREPFGKDAWPKYLEAAFFWRDHNELHTAYRDDHRREMQNEFAQLRDHDVAEFARCEVARTVGLDCKARFFLAGGAFKSLLTGKTPRDLDLWTPSQQDREQLIETLLARGAERLEPRPFADAFAVADRVVEIPHSVEPNLLENRLERFDLGLSAIGVEHQYNDSWKPIIHPLARTSVQKREILLLKPLVNWKYALSTLERMRRYAAELGFLSPPEEEAEVWRAFEQQPPQMRSEMIDRYKRTSHGGYNILEEVESRNQ